MRLHEDVAAISGSVVREYCGFSPWHGFQALVPVQRLLVGIRARVPDMILQVGGSISFAPEKEGAVARWLSDDTLSRKPAPAPR